ncbi:MAG TPA: hypothetical protein VIF33_07910 [Casimicrobiaceae bacterium]
MKPSMRWLASVSVAVATALTLSPAAAHSASDAYLTLEAGARATGSETVVHGQWDVALRDLDFALRLDDNGDGNITWRELRKHQAAIDRYAYAYLRASGDGRDCAIRPMRQQVSNHADGAYAALSFDIVCVGAPARLQLDYRMFFALDPSHRCILVFRSGTDTATALLSPDNARVDLKLKAS